ncbi:MAG: hypothetical protein LUF35_04825 [Lachnospiraceae bacterium]|nr:hypothetical protein [Lachnospiraceae bacterium]
MTEKRKYDSKCTEIPETNVHADGSNEISTPQDANHTRLSSINQTEDTVMKVMMEFFSEEMLPVFGITQSVKSFTMTEEVHLDINKGLQDFNLVMDDESIAHFEFQSTNGGRRDLQ